jgi:hypothetical protein
VSNYRNGWVIRHDGDDAEDRRWWTGAPGVFSDSLHEAVFFATEQDAHKVAREIGTPTALDFVHDPRPMDLHAKVHEESFKR